MIKKPREYVLEHIPKNSVGAEIGVHLGNFSEKIIAKSSPKMLYLIDPWKTFDDEKYKDSWYGSKTSQTEMDDRYRSVVKKFKNQNVKIIRDLSVNAANQIPDESLDWVYIDGDHSYEGSYNDLSTYYAKVKRGGLIYGDDYNINKWWSTGVIDALHQTLYEKKLKIVFLFGNQFCCKKI